MIMNRMFFLKLDIIHRYVVTPDIHVHQYLNIWSNIHSLMHILYYVFFWLCSEVGGNAFSTIYNSYIVAFSIIGRGNRKGAHRGDRRTASNNLTISKIKVVLSIPRQDSHYITLVDYIL